MVQKKVTYNQQYFNNIPEGIKTSDEITASYVQLIDLETRFTRNNMIIENTLTEDGFLEPA